MYNSLVAIILIWTSLQDRPMLSAMMLSSEALLPYLVMHIESANGQPLPLYWLTSFGFTA